MSSTSEIWSPTLNTGFRHEVGCWKIIEMRLPRMCIISDSGSSSRSRPSNRISPSTILPGMPTSRMIENEVTLLPQPDSPTRPSTSPRLT